MTRYRFTSCALTELTQATVYYERLCLKSQELNLDKCQYHLR
jgi:hypothetical protein